MRRGVFLIAVFLLAVSLAPAAHGLNIKLASLAPTGSPWELGLRRIAAEWERLSGRTITVRTYPGGVAGDEPDMVREIRIGTLNAALITVSGLQGIFKGVKTLSYPLLLRNDGELAYVLGKMKPYFEEELQKRGFKVVAWSPGGWVYIFSRFPVVTPDDLRRQKLWVWNSDPDEIQAFQNAGFQTVELASTDLTASLQGGMVDAVVTSPLVAASSQWFGIASNMCSLKLGPLWGAAIVSTRTWAEVPADLQPKLIESAQRILDGLAPDLVKSDGEAIAAMKEYGLKINVVPPQVEAEWAALLQKTFSGLVGRTYDRDAFQRATGYLNEYLSLHPRR